ncbi:hypothetical protein L596_023406 [Steinernema carpocapsae]|uniref:Uncharacterized protein n=1 Tax=Steinernema carpocapsae TaxID=34508 RepID=A0A4U5MDL0_STECR|nr:hypothetical protein L596_023406 [Steinernema carpocapsae]
MMSSKTFRALSTFLVTLNRKWAYISRYLKPLSQSSKVFFRDLYPSSKAVSTMEKSPEPDFTTRRFRRKT